jgi:tetratricopeptide (TPR) repeat protein
MAAGNYQRARELLTKLEARFPFGRYGQQAQIEIAYAFYKENDGAQAVAACDRFLKLNPNHPFADYVYYLKGLATFNDDLGVFGRTLGMDPTTRDPKAMRDAFEVFRELVNRFPDSRYALLSRARRLRGRRAARARSRARLFRHASGRGSAVHPGSRLRWFGATAIARRRSSRPGSELPGQSLPGRVQALTLSLRTVSGRVAAQRQRRERRPRRGCGQRAAGWQALSGHTVCRAAARRESSGRRGRARHGSAGPRPA